MRRIASHNSLTGYPVARWWQQWFRPFARCQKKSIAQQLDAGIRHFDLRVRHASDGRLIACHGLAEYRVDVDAVVKMLEEHGAYYRVVLENRLGGRHCSSDELCRLKRHFLSGDYPHCLYVSDKRNWETSFNPQQQERMGEKNFHHSWGFPEIVPIPVWWRWRYRLSRLPADTSNRETIYWIDWV